MSRLLQPLWLLLIAATDRELAHMTVSRSDKPTEADLRKNREKMYNWHAAAIEAALKNQVFANAAERPFWELAAAEIRLALLPANAPAAERGGAVRAIKAAYDPARRAAGVLANKPDLAAAVRDQLARLEFIAQEAGKP